MSDILTKKDLDQHVVTLAWYDQKEPLSQSFLIYKQSFLKKLKKFNAPYTLLIQAEPTKDFAKWILENDLDYNRLDGL